MMSPIASAPFFTFNFSRFQHAFLRVYLYFILKRLIFTFKVPLVTEIFSYQRLMFEFARNPISHQTKITISNTPTMTKNDSSAAAVAQSSALLPPQINANTPSGRDPAISPAVSLPMRPSARPFPTGRFLPGRRADQQATSCFGSSPEAAGSSPFLPQIDIDRIEPCRGGEGEYYVYSASNRIQNSPRVLLFSRRCSYLRGPRLLEVE
jgi:hypothetical protein